MRIRLPLPARILHPNCRSHWAAKSRAVKSHRERAKRETFKLLKDIQKPIIIGYILRPTYRDSRKRDQDGCVSSAKAFLDGIADTFGQDDSTWRCLGVEPAPPDKTDPHLIIELVIEEF